MTSRYRVVAGAVVALSNLAPWIAVAQSADTPRTAWGAPDLVRQILTRSPKRTRKIKSLGDGPM